MIRISLPLLFTFILAAAVVYFAYGLFGWLGLLVAAFLVAAFLVAAFIVTAIKRELPQS